MRDRSLIEEAARVRSIVPLRDRSIGAMLVDSGRLAPDDVPRVLSVQHERGLRFGDAAVSLGLVTPVEVDAALSRQHEYTVLGSDDTSISREVVAAFEPGHPTVEALSHLRAQLQLRWIDPMQRRQVLAVVSAERGVGKSYIAANLAVLFAQLGGRTLLIDANLREPRQHELFRLDNRIGLSTVLTDRAGLESARPIDAFARLCVMTAGPAAPNPLELVSRSQFVRLLDAASDHYDVIIVDTPACAAGADATITAARTGAAVLVARPHRTSAKALAHVARRLGDHGTVLVGSVLNEP